MENMCAKLFLIFASSHVMCSTWTEFQTHKHIHPAIKVKVMRKSEKKKESSYNFKSLKLITQLLGNATLSSE